MRKVDTHNRCLKPGLGIERGESEYVLEVAVVWRVPLLDPARREAIIGTLWWNRGARRLRRGLMGWVITLALRLALVRRTL